MTDKEKRESRMKYIKLGVKIAVCTLVEIFFGAVTNSVLGEVKGGKMAKFGAKAGGGLLGAYTGMKIGDYICDAIDELSEDIENVEESIGESK